MISALLKSLLRDCLGNTAKQQMRNALYSPLALRDYIFFSLQGVESHSSWRIWGLPILQLHQRGGFQAGRNLILCSRSQDNSLGVIQPVVIKTVTANARIAVGENVGISGSTLSARLGIRIGNNVLIGSGSIITDTDSHPLDHKNRNDASLIKSKEVEIGDNVFIGARSIILKGVKIGAGTVIGAGSVLSSSTEENAIYAGNPAKFIRKL